MRKFLSLSLALMTLGLVVSCATKSSPGAAAKQYAEYIGNGAYDKLLDGIYFGEEATPEEVAEYKTGLKSMIEEKVAPELEKKGGLKSVEILSETIADDGLSAEVVFKQTYGNGEVEEGPGNLVLVDGKWMMAMEK